MNFIAHCPNWCQISNNNPKNYLTQSEQEKTQDIITSLSKKYSSVEAKQRPSVTRNRKIKAKILPESPVESGASIYDFEVGADEVRLKLELSPSPKKRKVKPIRRKKKSSKENQTPVNKKSSRSKKTSPATSIGDSGVFMTPPSLLISDINTVTSTPSALPEFTPVTSEDFTGFDSQTEDLLSPVQKISDSDDGRLVSKTYESGTSDKKKKGTKKKALPKKFQKSISKAEELAMKMNKEFDELDNFTLSVQDE
ncbi:hypothetical protein CAPTEDRAFT_222320 [Capitella teleta]|uniref:Uncharacterized protein n=1 Tax=Capitella teleta TaxID=283909 RepID=R7U0Q8_CAPTE|nr:hypothetical protein CAPTEDRAFT_222320 [Capitella teleta]|eukprot:ELT99447.1 hypothetical protein CAPTEDRAFT_222320 [Capitella teleta]